ncbi:chemotaxis protein CheY [Pseudomonas taeanensis MS-3]|uniref:Chemotaxis protein CheY n=1 Tax=Pseudomonas taeanensis MS-3 TaxID=1395571 RepID=A0A0A1YNR7_9PSED|nr:response regulator [Pseudomonas taeanensis]KFX70736.1 chemotaxis protein CheY [Pseudomonas taeanensis MS-3]
MRVMILEDDHWIADLLKQIVLSLRPGAQVSCLETVADALLDWQQNAADLVIADWNLPDDPGTLLLEQIRRDNRQVPLVMITGRADRNSVMEVRPLGISAFISKPFQVPKVLECLERLLPPAEDNPPTETGTSANLSAYLAELPADDLDLPLQPGMLDDLQTDAAAPPTLQVLNQRWQTDPALTARLVAAANSRQYNQAGIPCLSLTAALQALGPATSLNIGLGLGLRPSAELQDAELQLQALAHMQQVERLSQRVRELAEQCQIDPAPLQTAAALHRIGELCVLHHAQLWQNAGNTLDAEQLSQALDEVSNELANRLKAHWRLPVPLRELIGACYVLPGNNVKRETLLMRLAASELDATPNSNDQARLRRLAGLS